MKEPFLSIVIPIYNGEQTIRPLMESIQKQDFDDYEIILINDGSNDNSLEICESYAKADDRIQVIDVENGGVSKARNTGLNVAKGNWVQFIDVDDTISQEMFRGFEEVVKNNDVDLVICGCIREHLTDKTKVECGPKENRIFSERECRDQLKNSTMEERYWLLDYIWNKWYKREILSRYEISFEEELSIGEDFVFNTEYYKHIHSLGIINKHYYHYYVGSNGLASRFRQFPWKGREKLLEAHRGLFEALGISDFQTVVVQAGQIGFGDLRTINNRDCYLDYNQKCTFIREMMNSSLYECIKVYLKEEAKWFHKLYGLFLSIGQPNLLLNVILLEKWVRKKGR